MRTSTRSAFEDVPADARPDSGDAAREGLGLARIIKVRNTTATASAAPARAASPEAGLATAVNAPAGDRVELRIKELHTKLKIIPAQEELWSNVAQVMRDNAKTMGVLVKARSEKANTMNAIDDLKSFSEIAEAHADGLKKFTPAFEPLYAGMSDAQKKDADRLFHHQDHKKSRAKRK
jgi:periplasmic protein CpxP/Spy